MPVVTVTEAFTKFLEDKNIANLASDLYIGVVPSVAPDNVYWVQTSGGSPIQRLRTGEMVKQYFISVYYRSTSGKDVERKMFELEELLNCVSCVDLEGFETIEIEATQFPSDIDLDNEERRIGFLQANIKLYKTC